jgi:thiamine biosynthesis lipoprotein
MSASFRAMGCEVAVGGRVDLDAVRALFERYESVFSRFRAGSELNRLNDAGGGTMSRLFADVLETALWARARTDGLVDPTLGGALAAAGYDRDFAAGLDRGEPAGPPVPARAVRRIGRVLILPRGVRLDLDGVVKGLAVDCAAGLLDGDGYVAAGGDIATRGPVDVAVAGGAVRVRGGIATSGSTRRRWRRAGRVVHHLIDPATGAPADSPWREVTVCGATCLAADVAAKAAYLLGERGPAWLDARGLPGRFVRASGELLPNAAWAAACT